MSQQRPAQEGPSLLVDPAEETVRRRCRDPINVEGLLVSPGGSLRPARLGCWRLRAGEGSRPGGSRLRPAAPFPHWGSRTGCLLNYELAQGWAVAAPLSPLCLHCPLCTINQPGPSLKLCCLLSTRTLKCVSLLGFYLGATEHCWRKLLNFALENLVFLPLLALSISLQAIVFLFGFLSHST